jgi:hypothetical protein
MKIHSKIYDKLGILGIASVAAFGASAVLGQRAYANYKEAVRIASENPDIPRLMEIENELVSRYEMFDGDRMSNQARASPEVALARYHEVYHHNESLLEEYARLHKNLSDREAMNKSNEAGLRMFVYGSFAVVTCLFGSMWALLEKSERNYERKKIIRDKGEDNNGEQ